MTHRLGDQNRRVPLRDFRNFRFSGLPQITTTSPCCTLATKFRELLIADVVSGGNWEVAATCNSGCPVGTLTNAPAAPPPPAAK
jgi:hypothetical protein